MKKAIIIKKDMTTLETIVVTYKSLEEAQKVIEKQIADGILEKASCGYDGTGIQNGLKVHLVEAS